MGSDRRVDHRDAYIEELEERIDQYKRENAKLEANLLVAVSRHNEDMLKLRADAALVVHALDCAIQLTEALIMFTPHGTAMSDSVATCKHSLDVAIDAIRRREGKL